MVEFKDRKRQISDNSKRETNALYYPETICLDESELKYFLLLYDKIFFLPLDIQLNPGHTRLSKRFSIYDSILSGSYRSQRDTHYSLMYCSEPDVWDDPMKRLMDLYDELEEKGIAVGLEEEDFRNPSEFHPMKDAVHADLMDKDFISVCTRYRNPKIFVPPIENAKLKGGGFVSRPAAYKEGLNIPGICSERLNSALYISGRENLFPVCGNRMYVDLLKPKLKRAALMPPNHPTPSSSIHRFSLLSWEIATEVIPWDIARQASPKDLLKYKNACIDLKDKFRSHLWSLEATFSSEPWEDRFHRELDIIVKKDIIPEVQRIREGKIVIWEKLFGDTLKSLASIKIGVPLVGIHLVAGLSFWDILTLSTAAIGGTSLTHLIDAWKDERKLKRNALFFLVDFEKQMRKI